LGAGGYGIWRWDSSRENWAAVDGAAVRIAVDEHGEPWVVNASGQIYQRRSGAWHRISGGGDAEHKSRNVSETFGFAGGVSASIKAPPGPGGAKDIGIGGGQVFVIGMDSAPGGYGIWKREGPRWRKYPGSGVRIAVDNRAYPWVVNNENEIYRWSGSSWQRMPGAAKDIGIGTNGSVAVIGTNSTSGGYGVYEWNSSTNSWKTLFGAGTNVAVDSAGKPWVTNSSQRVYRYGSAR
jgi:hypothetical protein